MKMKALLVAALLALLLSLPALATEPPLKSDGADPSGPIRPEEVPQPLQPWIGWALYGLEEGLCPFLSGAAERVCAWPSPLSLSLDSRGGTFSQRWRLYRRETVVLPGDREHWPIEVKGEGKPLAVTSVDGRPALFLEAGTHAISGAFAWDDLPESLPLPPESGIVNLSIEGKAVPLPTVDDEGVLWIGKDTGSRERLAGDSFQIRVCRLMVDDIPFRLVTRLTLDVSGASRETSLGDPLPEGFIPMEIKSPLPARLDASGVLRAQLRAGTWEIDLVARAVGPVAEIAAPKPEPERAAWPNEEIWSFEAMRDLRVASVEGVPPVDPQQTLLPESWKSYPSYRVLPGEAVRLLETMRGDADTAPEQIHLHRELWLDFDGGGYTVRDRLTGKLRDEWRLEAEAPLAPGRVSTDGTDLFITRVPGSPRVGVELRRGNLNVVADSRIAGRLFSLPAVGWDRDVASSRANLHLGPGWRLLAAWGADSVPTSWVSRWSLLQIFLALILTLSFGKLWGVRWGAIALAGFALLFQEKGAPMWSWCGAIAAIALSRAVPEGKASLALRILRIAAILLLAGISIPFATGQLRTALHPSLEKPSATSAFLTFGAAKAGKGEAEDMESMPAIPPPAAVPDGMMQDKGAPQEDSAMEGADGRPRRIEIKKQLAEKLSNRDFITPQSVQSVLNAPGAQVQTGPGIPSWTWQSHNISWSGPVKAGQRLTLFLVPPRLHALFSCVRVAILALLLACVSGLPINLRPRWPGRRAAAIAIFLAASAVLLLPSRAQAAEFPSKELLQELATRLTKTPECSPNCAEIPRLWVEADAQRVRLRFEANAAASTAIPLPGFSSGWAPEKASRDGEPFASAWREEDGNVWMELPAGVHQVILEGPASDRTKIAIPLPLKPRRVEPSLSGWTISGIGENGLPDENLELVRSETAEAPSLPGTEKSDRSQQLPPFVRVERTISLGIEWHVRTEVERATAGDQAILLQIPLLPGETPTTTGLRVEEGRAIVGLTPQARSFSWDSTLAAAEKLSLEAPEASSWMELWRLDASPIWHVEASGIPPVHQRDESGSWLPEWRPWPGEKLSLAISRPEGVPGQTLTVDESSLELTPSMRSTEALLKLAFRSSLGGQHEISLPPNAKLTAIFAAGIAQPIRQQGGKVTLPVSPGKQEFEIRWREDRGIAPFFRSPAVDLGIPSVNAKVLLHVPFNRWILFVGGPRLGPAVLMWSLVVVLSLAAWGLGRWGYAPLPARRWFLLGIGLALVSAWHAMIVVGWFVLVEWRRRSPPTGPFRFNLLQLGIVLWTVVTLIIIADALKTGLLGFPDMSIAGNHSTASELAWFSDRSGTRLPRGWTISLPLFAYRAAMLAWAMWFAFHFLRWLRWSWSCFSSGGRWRQLRTVVR